MADIPSGLCRLTQHSVSGRLSSLRAASAVAVVSPFPSKQSFWGVFSLVSQTETDRGQSCWVLFPTHRDKLKLFNTNYLPWEGKQQMETPKSTGGLSREKVCPISGPAPRLPRKRTESSLREQVQTTNPYLFSLGSYCQSTGNCKKRVLPGIRELGGGSLGRHKYFRL